MLGFDSRPPLAHVMLSCQPMSRRGGPGQVQLAPTTDTIAVLLNRSSGATARTGPDNRALDAVRAALATAGLEASVQVAEGRVLGSLARRAVANGARLVVAAGGDGTASTVAAALVGTDASLGILPLGTLNHFAKDLGIPLDVAGAAAVIASGRTAHVDVGEVNGRIFINNSSVGLYPSLVYHREKSEDHGRGRWVALALALSRVWRLYRRVRVSLSTGGVSRQIRTPFVFVGNNEYHLEGVRIGARARLDAGLLHVSMAPGLGRAEMLYVLGRALAGRSTDDRLDTLLVPEIAIDARRRRVPVALDGEIALVPTPLRYRTRPGALRVCVPDPAAAPDGATKT
jgi:diacylglycerol kinase family enzyme